MPWLLIVFSLSFIASPGWAGIPDAGVFHYQLFDNSHREVGTYHFTIAKNDKVWRISSEMDVDTRVFFLKVRLQDHNSFVHDGQSFQSFELTYFKDVPLQATVNQKVEGRIEGQRWIISSTRNGQKLEKTFPVDAFTEVRNLVSRLIRPDAVVARGSTRSAQSLDPLTMNIEAVESRGLREESVDFQGKNRRLHVIEQKAADGDVLVKKFDNGLIYRSETAEGYALLKSAVTPDF